MARISTPALTPKMYRHFAVVTMMGTVLLAMFSNGENRQAISDRIEAEQAAAKARRDAMRAKYGTPKLTIADNSSAGANIQFNDYGDSSDGFGAPMDASGSEVQNVGPLSGQQTRCAKGQFVEQAKSDEDVAGPPQGRCIGAGRTANVGPRPTGIAGHKADVDALVAATLKGQNGSANGE
jgi:hypothetical protein